MSAETAAYVDASAIVKLVVREAESAALQQHLKRHDTLVTSAIARTEVRRAAIARGDLLDGIAVRVLEQFELLRVSDRVLEDACTLRSPGLRTLDAIHLASALTLKGDLADFVCYDARLCGAATAYGLSVTGPA